MSLHLRAHADLINVKVARGRWQCGQLIPLERLDTLVELVQAHFPLSVLDELDAILADSLDFHVQRLVEQLDAQSFLSVELVVYEAL